MIMCYLLKVTLPITKNIDCQVSKAGVQNQDVLYFVNRHRA